MYAAAVLLSVYLSIHSHLAEVRNFSSFGLRLAAYCFASIIALMSYSHWALDWRPTFPAVACTLLSLSSPALWRVHSRTLAQERLRELGLIDGHAVRLGAARFALHPVKSFRVLRIAVWSGEQEPARAIAAWEASLAGNGCGNGLRNDVETPGVTEVGLGPLWRCGYGNGSQRVLRAGTGAGTGRVSAR